MEGQPYQLFINLPFGELMAEQTGTRYQSPYKFNGKELDPETGLYYYGARYYDPQSSTWLSVDPLAEKYAGWTPYNYCVGNPVVFVDPDGREVDITTNINKKTGAKTVTFKVTMSIKNKSNYSDEIVKQKAELIKKRIEKSYNSNQFRYT